MTRPPRSLRALGQGVATDTGWGIVLEVVRIATTLVSFTLLGRSLGAAGYGNYAALYAIIGPLSALASAGIGLALLEHIIRNGEDEEATFRSCLSMSIGLGTLLLFAGTGAASLVVDLRISTIATMFALEMVMLPVFFIATNLIRARDGFAAAVRYRLTVHVVKMVVLIVLFSRGELTIRSFGATSLVITGVLAVILIRAVGRRYEISSRPGRIDRRHFRSSLVYSAGIVGLSVQTDGDKLLLASYGQTLATGLYSAAYRVVQLGLLPITAIVGATHHRFLEHNENERGEHLGRALTLSRLALVYGVVVGAGLVLVAPLLPLLVGSEFDESAEIVRWLAPLVVIRGLAIFPLNGLMGLGKTKLRTVLLLASSVLSIGIYVWLIPQHSWRGAAVGTLVGELVLAVAAWVLLVHHQRRHDATLDGAPYQPRHARIEVG